MHFEEQARESKLSLIKLHKGELEYICRTFSHDLQRVIDEPNTTELRNGEYLYEGWAKYHPFNLKLERMWLVFNRTKENSDGYIISNLNFVPYDE